MFRKFFFVCIAALIFLSVSLPAFSQSSLEERVSALENYMQAVEPSLNKFANDLQNGMQNYTKQLESGLEQYSLQMQQNLNDQIQFIRQKTVILDPASKMFQKIETNAGTFLIYVDKISKSEGGYSITLYIGNPYVANFKDFKLIFTWGKKRSEKSVMPYEDWRNSLKSAEYTFRGVLERGKWNQVEVNLSPAEAGDIGYLECQMHVSSAELQFSE